MSISIHLLPLGGLSVILESPAGRVRTASTVKCGGSVHKKKYDSYEKGWLFYSSVESAIASGRLDWRLVVACHRSSIVPNVQGTARAPARSSVAPDLCDGDLP